LRRTEEVKKENDYKKSLAVSWSKKREENVQGEEKTDKSKSFSLTAGRNKTK